MKKLILLAVIFLLPVLMKADYLTVGNPDSPNSQYYAPFCRWFNYSASSVIYVQSEMGDAKTLTHIAFDKVSGVTNMTIEDVEIWARHTDDEFVQTIYYYDTDDYQLIYEGDFPNDDTGWMEVQLSSYFDYNGTNNLQLLFIKNQQSYASGYPYYRMTSTSGRRLTFAYSDASMPTGINSYYSNYQLNVRFQYSTGGGAVSGGGTDRYPKDFEESNNLRHNGAISTGYYWTDSRDMMDAKWLPEVEVADTNVQTGLWRKIDAGPNIKGKAYWTNNPPEGLAFFRNPADGDYFRIARDTVDDAFAGPIPLGIDGGFYFNGIRYDSFYVSTNGLIALSNRRYYYDNEGNRTIPEGATNAYDANSMDWFTIGDTEIGNPTTGVRGRDIERDGMGNPVFGPTGEWVTKDGLNDPVPDNFGHTFMAIGMDPDTMMYIPGNNGGIRAVPDITKTNSINDVLLRNRKGAIIAPFWGDLHLSQFNDRLNNVDGHGKVYYKRSADGTKLTIAIYNIAPKGINWWWSAKGNEFVWDAFMNLRPGDQDYIAADCQVVLDSKDSSVSIVYNGFHGALRSVPSAYDNLPDSVRAQDIFKFNTLAGVYGPSRLAKDTVNYNDVSQNSYYYPWGGEYFQYTDYYQNTQNPNIHIFRDDTLVAKFKQWKNTLRAANVHYLVRNTDPESDMSFVNKIPYEFANDYEMLAGEKRVGAIQPVGMVQNLTNDVQGVTGVNYVNQDLEFQARLKIINQITGRTIYNNMVYVSDRCMDLDDADAIECTGTPNVRVKLAKNVVNQGNGNYDVEVMTPAEYRTSGNTGVPPYKFAQVTFPPFEPNVYFDNNIGAQRVYLIAEPKKPGSGLSLHDQWPFDDTLRANLNILRRITELNDDVTEYHLDLGRNIAIPSALYWVNLNAEVVSGDEVSKHPLAPRGKYSALNAEGFELSSPVIKMNRLTLDGTEPPGKLADARGYNGDEIRSHPIDMRGKHGAILSIAVQRAEYRENWRRDYMDSELIGPEPRTIFTSLNDNTAFTVLTGTGAISEKPDELVVQFAKPSSDGLNGIVNDVEWSYHPRPDGQLPILDNPALTVFGAGGYQVGFLEEDPNVPLELPMAPNYNGLRPDRYDDGIDFEYKKYFVQIPDTFINWENEAAKNFRFRIKVMATNDSKSILDDADDFFVDNIRILVPSEVTDIEVSSVKVDWPYTLIPASQATSVPVTVNVSNNTSYDAPVFYVKVKINRITKDEDGNVIDEEEAPIYCRTETIGNLNGGNALDLGMPSWNIRKSQIDTTSWYRIYAISVYPGMDLIPSNDTTYTDVKIQFGDQFAYDHDPLNPNNDVEDEMNITGRGLTLFGSNYAEAIGGRNFTVEDRAGTQVGDGSGQIAMKFRVLNSDTLRGIRAFFGSLNSYPDYMRLRLYDNRTVVSKYNTTDSIDKPDSIMAEMLRLRGINDGDNVIRTNEFVTYLFDEPMILQKGTYWISIEQQSGKRGLHLGASASRSGTRITKFFEPNDGNGTTIDTFGTQGLNLYVDKAFRKMSVDGRLVNNNFFAYENITDSREWVPFTPPMGNPAYPHFGHYGFFNGTSTLSGGTWIPLLRPYFGYKTHGSLASEYQWCPDQIPVELISFDGEVRQDGIDLFWETASEENNYGFYLERRLYNDEELPWNEIGFVSGSGNSNVINRYNYMDKEVVAGNTYQYRVKQIDFDGTESCATTNIVTLTYNNYVQAELLPNVPNPVTENTLIRFILPEVQDVKLEVLDVYGNVIATLLDGTAQAGENSVKWTAISQSGNASTKWNIHLQTIN
jgi:hypothetical protein